MSSLHGIEKTDDSTTVSKILEGAPSFSLPDTSEDIVPKLRHFDENDFKSKQGY